MKIGVLKERLEGEARVAATPETAEKLHKAGAAVLVEAGAGAHSHISNGDFKATGASIEKERKACLGADVVLCVNLPLAENSKAAALPAFKKGTVLVGMLSPFQHIGHIEKLAEQQVTAFALEFMPRISRAQSMDVLSSQSNLAGYKAVIDAVATLTKAVPMMMTAAGTVKPANILVLGAGVAGLQAVATAKRLGGVVSAFDVRPAVKEQVESLGATFIEVEDSGAENAETKGGYAKEMSAEYKRKQQQLIHDTIKTQDIVITTALIPGKPAPVLIPENMVKDMKEGSVIVDLAALAGGNCPLSEAGKVVKKHGVTIIGHDNFPSRLAADASQLYARNMVNFVLPLIDKEKKALAIDLEDEIIKGCMVTHGGKVVHPLLQDLVSKKSSAASSKPKRKTTAKAPPKKVMARKPHLKKKARTKAKAKK